MKEKTWEEFQKTGLLLFINQFLRIFGWSIVIEMKKRPAKEREFVRAYPARVKCRGFKNKSVDEAYEKVQTCLENNITELREDLQK